MISSYLHLSEISSVHYFRQILYQKRPALISITHITDGLNQGSSSEIRKLQKVVKEKTWSRLIKDK